MQSSICPNCNIQIFEGAVFCHICGNRLKCSSCNSDLIKDAKFCISCGESVQSRNASINDLKNTAKYHRKGDEIFCEVSLNNEVAKDGIVSLFDNLANNRQVEYKKLNNNQRFDSTKLAEVEIEESQDDSKNHTQESNAGSETEQKTFPHLNDIEINLNCSEGEWILIYAFYESNFASKTFNRKSVYDKYMAKRRTPERVKNYSANWKGLFKKYFSTVNDSEFKFKRESLDDIGKLILGQKKTKARESSKIRVSNKVGKESNDSSETASKQKTAKKLAGQTQSYTLVTDLNLVPNGVESLKDFYARYIPSNNPEIILVIMYYLENILKSRNIGENTLYTCLKTLHLPVPNIRQTLNNIHSRKGWINTTDFLDLKVTIAGENFIEHEMTKKK